LEQLAHDVGEPATVRLGRADVMDRHDVRMVELPRRPRFALETPQAVFVGREGAGQHLYGDVAGQPRVPGAIHLAHPSLSEQGLNLVWAQARAWRDGVGHGVPGVYYGRRCAFRPREVRSSAIDESERPASDCVVRIAVQGSPKRRVAKMPK